MIEINRLNLFTKTRYSLAEEDRVTNALLLLLQDSTISLFRSFMKELGIFLHDINGVHIRDHIPYDERSIVDGEILIADNLLLMIESKVEKGQFDTNDQIIRYYKLLQSRNENMRLLLLLSPDNKEPDVVKTLSKQYDSCHLIWRSWGKIASWLQGYFEVSDKASDVEDYLIFSFLSYLTALGLVKTVSQGKVRGKGLTPQLRYILGNTTAERVLLHIFHHNGTTGRQIARDHNLALDPIQKQLKRFEKAGVLRKERHGKSSIYYFREDCPFLPEIIGLIRKAYEYIPEEMRKRVFEPDYTLNL